MIQVDYRPIHQAGVFHFDSVASAKVALLAVAARQGGFQGDLGITSAPLESDPAVFTLHADPLREAGVRRFLNGNSGSKIVRDIDNDPDVPFNLCRVSWASSFFLNVHKAEWSALREANKDVVQLNLKDGGPLAHLTDEVGDFHRLVGLIHCDLGISPYRLGARFLLRADTEPERAAVFNQLVSLLRKEGLDKETQRQREGWHTLFNSELSLIANIGKPERARPWLEVVVKTEENFYSPGFKGLSEKAHEISAKVAALLGYEGPLGPNPVIAGVMMG